MFVNSWTGAGVSRHVVRGILCGVCTAILVLPVTAQQTRVDSANAATLQLTSSSEVANEHFWNAMAEAQNIRFRTAAELLDHALSADPEFGLALALKGFVAPGLTGQQRQEMISEAINMMGDATAAEIMTATALREWRGGNMVEARHLLDVVGEMVPGDPNVAFYQAQSKLGGATPEVGVLALRSVIERFPDQAPAYNILAYQLFNRGDERGAFEMAREYMSRLPNHPNSHDTYAELLQWDGRFEEALGHYRRTLALDDRWIQGWVGQAEVLQMMGEGEQAREKLQSAMGVAATDAARVNLHRAIGNSFAVEGNRSQAMEHLGAAVREANAANLNNLVALAHQEMALYDAALGNGRGVAGHLSAAAEAQGPALRHTGLSAIAYALAGDVDNARTAVRELAETAGSNVGWNNTVHDVNALILLEENDADGAIRELGQSDPGNIFTRSIMAEAYKASDREADAETFRRDVLNDRRINMYNAVWMISHYRADKM